MPFDKEPVVKDTETQGEEVDLSEAQAEISSELFGQGNDEDEGGGDDQPGGEGDAADEKVQTDPSRQQDEPDAEKEKPEGEEAAAEEDNSEAVQELGAPKTWTKEALADWATIPDRAKQEILKREEDFLKGITQYKEAADLGVAYSKVVAPYEPILAAENVDPVQMFQSFAANHYLLSRGTPAQKVELAANLINGYQIPLQPLLEFIAAGGEQDLDPNVAALKKELDDLKRGLHSRTQAENTQQLQRIEKEIDDFRADPAHPYFDEVAADIQRLFGSGMAENLAEAYEKAVYANPVTRAKEIDRLTAERASAAKTEEEKRKDKREKSQADHVKSTSKAKDGTVPKGSIDDTLRETLAAIESRGD